MRGLVMLLVVSAAVLGCHAAAVDRADDELVDLLNKLQSQLRSRAPKDPPDANKVNDEEVDVKAKAKDEEEEELDINIVRAAESHHQSRQGGDAAPPSGSAAATDPRPDIATNVLQLIISLLDDSLKLTASLESGGSGKAGKGVRLPDGSSEIIEESDDSSDSSEEESGSGSDEEDSEDGEEDSEATDDSQALHDRPVGDKRAVKTARRQRRAVAKDADENEAGGAEGSGAQGSGAQGGGAQGGSGSAQDGSDSVGNSTTSPAPGSPIVAKMLETVVELQYNLIAFDLITMYPSGHKSGKAPAPPPMGDAAKRTSSSDQLAEIMSQLDRLEKRHN